MPSNRVDSTTTTGAVVTSAASPVTLHIPPHSTPVVLTITSGSAITVTGATGPGHPVDITHTP